MSGDSLAGDCFGPDDGPRDDRGFKEYTIDDYLALDVAVLKKQRLMVNIKIQAAREGLEDGDERAPEALVYFREQRRLINQALQVKLYGEEGPPAQEIGLKTLSVAGAAKRKIASPRSQQATDDGRRAGVASIEEFLRLFVSKEHQEEVERSLQDMIEDVKEEMAERIT